MRDEADGTPLNTYFAVVPQTTSRRHTGGQWDALERVCSTWAQEKLQLHSLTRDAPCWYAPLVFSERGVLYWASDPDLRGCVCVCVCVYFLYSTGFVLTMFPCKFSICAALDLILKGGELPDTECES